MFKVIIAGSREFYDYRLLCATLDHLFQHIPLQEIEIVCGKAKGADILGERYAHEHQLAIKYFPAKWKVLGKRAGYVRNEEMAEYADALVAFWDGKSPGTRHMIAIAKKYGLPIRVKNFLEEGAKNESNKNSVGCR